MSALSPQQKAEMCAATRGVAITAIEDIQHFRDILNRDDVSAPEVRRASVALRRLLPNSELREAASPRIGRFKVDVPKEPPMNQHVPLFFVRGGAPLGGLNVADAVAWPKELSAEEMKALHQPEQYNPDMREPVRVDNFLSADVLFYAGRWVTRQQVILFVANLSGAAHSGRPKEPEERVLALIRRVLKINHPKSGKPFVSFEPHRFMEKDAPLRYSVNEMDAVLYELYCTMHFLVNSADTARLEESVRLELAA